MDQYVGQIMRFSFFYAPDGWMECAGQLVSVSTYQVLFSLLGTKYGGDGINTFGLPDMRNAILFTAGMKYYIAYNGVYPSRS